jgi:dTDP-4-dehydrorhamnose 3,5-epimerase-like enzyme
LLADQRKSARNNQKETLQIFSLIDAEKMKPLINAEKNLRKFARNIPRKSARKNPRKSARNNPREPNMIIPGNKHTDHRGTLRFVNDFGFDGVKRFYTITHPDTATLRAWQGHQRETKYFYAGKGAFKISWVKIDNWEQPSKDLEINHKELTDTESEVLVIAPGHATAIRALQPDSTLLVFSDMTLEESKGDDHRFDIDYWMLEH